MSNLRRSFNIMAVLLMAVVIISVLCEWLGIHVPLGQ
jgi:hypothetical protein